MEKKVPHPNWIGLYALVAGVLGIFLLESRAAVSVNTHRALEIGLLIALFSLIELWLRANERALWLEDHESYRDALRRAVPSTREPQPPLPAPAGDQNQQKSLTAHFPAWVLSALAWIGAFLHPSDL